MDIEENLCLCALNRVFGYQPVLGHTLVRFAGSAAAVFRMDPDTLREALGVHRDLAAGLTPAALEKTAAELEWTTSQGFRFLPFGDPGYPSLLAECPDPPLGLYLRTTSPPSELFGRHPCIAFVGTRDLSPYGREWCRKLVGALGMAPTRSCIVSGLAFGADAVAHRTALECGLTTLGVMATGIERVYPWQHTDLAAEIVRTPGCGVLTDYPPGTVPAALNFIRRNRIIAGLCRATVVIESKTKGGSLITARYAWEYDRDIFALPGRAGDIRSAGCNALIRKHRADIITDPEDLAERLSLGAPLPKRAESFADELTRRYGADSPLTRIGLLVRDRPDILQEDLCRETGWSWEEVSRCTGTLEMDGLLEKDVLQQCRIPANIL